LKGKGFCAFLRGILFMQYTIWDIHERKGQSHYKIENKWALSHVDIIFYLA